VDTLGLLLLILVTTANVSDQAGAKLVLAEAKPRLPRLKKIWADAGYKGAEFIAWVAARFGWTLEIVQHRTPTHKFEVQRWRWIVERTFGWLNRYRRLSKEYEELPQTSETVIRIAMINLMVQRLARQRDEKRQEKQAAKRLALQQVRE
jgi:putative transposase